LAAASKNSVQSGESESDEEEESKEPPIRLPKVSHGILFRCITSRCSGHIVHVFIYIARNALLSIKLCIKDNLAYG
jgi:hypothetical protein